MHGRKLTCNSEDVTTLSQISSIQSKDTLNTNGKPLKQLPKLEQLQWPDKRLGSKLKSLFAVAEAYPDLKANENFLQLQEELVSTESRIAFARQHYNDSVLGYNNKIETFPSNAIAGAFKFKQAEFFETEDEATGPVEVNF